MVFAIRGDKDSMRAFADFWKVFDDVQVDIEGVQCGLLTVLGRKRSDVDFVKYIAEKYNVSALRVE